jgi:hypothetical protein
VHVEIAAVRRRDAGCVLTAVLQEQQAVIDQLIDRRLGNYAYDAAHGMSFKGTKFVTAAGAGEASGSRRCPAYFLQRLAGL